jgi:hypothetical protein
MDIENVISLSSLKEINTLFVFGVVKGDPLLSLNEWLQQNSSRRVVVVEENQNHLNDFLKKFEVLKIKLHERMSLLSSIKEINKYLIHPDSQKFLVVNLSDLPQQRFTIFKNSITCAIKNFTLYREEVLTFGGIVLQNFYKNVLNLPKAYHGKALFGKFKGVPAIIVGAGPSLASQLSVLEKSKNKALIFAGGTSINALSSSQVIPHFGTAVDPNRFQVNRLAFSQAFEVPFFYSNRLHAQAFKLLQGEKIYLPCFLKGSIDHFFEQFFGLESVDEDVGMSVTTLNMMLAFLMGCDPIILVGVDLAYTKGLSYSSTVSNEAFDKMEAKLEKEGELLEVKDIYGHPIHTLWKWVDESLWISKFAKEKPVRVINATGGGIGFEGVSNEILEEILKEIPQSKIDLERKVFEEVFRAKMPEKVTKEGIENLLNLLKNEFKAVFEGVKTPEETLCYEAFFKKFIGDYSKIFELDRLSQSETFFKNLNLKIKEACLFHLHLIETPFSQEEKVIKDENGRVRIRLQEKNGLRDGTCFFYKESGILSSSLSYKEGRLDGEVFLFDDLTPLKTILYFKEGKRISFEEFLKEKKKRLEDKIKEIENQNGSF